MWRLNYHAVRCRTDNIYRGMSGIHPAPVTNTKRRTNSTAIERRQRKRRLVPTAHNGREPVDNLHPTPGGKPTSLSTRSTMINVRVNQADTIARTHAKAPTSINGALQERVQLNSGHCYS